MSNVFIISLDRGSDISYLSGDRYVAMVMETINRRGTHIKRSVLLTQDISDAKTYDTLKEAQHNVKLLAMINKRVKYTIIEVTLNAD